MVPPVLGLMSNSIGVLDQASAGALIHETLILHTYLPKLAKPVIDILVDL